MADLPQLEALLATAREIKERTTEGGNTADIVGGFLENVINYLQDVYDKLASGSQAIEYVRAASISEIAVNDNNYPLNDVGNYATAVAAINPDGNYNIILPQAADNVGKQVIIHTYGSIILLPKEDDVILNYASEGYTLAKDESVTLIAINTNTWVIIK